MKDNINIAYFCMEYGLDESLPLYAGGLGVLAGDYLKAAREQNKSIIGIGLRWWQDYTTQHINETGQPYDTFPVHNPDCLQDTETEVYVNIENKKIKCKVWKVSCFNNNPLYLLDCGSPGTENGWICDKLYGGNDRDRIAQEIVLGIGGIKLIRKLKIPIDIYHFNEGHAAFAGFELIREKIEGHNMKFKKALKETRKEIIFTTHTPVPAGNEEHDLDLLIKMSANNGLNRSEMEKLGGNPFNMTAACLHMAGLANGVSELHGKTARKMWKDLTHKPPIIHVTNGIHLPTWQNKNIFKNKNNNNKLWQTHQNAKKRLINYIKTQTNANINLDTLLIGFARRAAPYKRSELIFKDTEQIDNLLREKRIQLVFSGKAHPDDHYGKKIVSTLVAMDRKYKDSVVFLENYNMEVAHYLIQGCDVWLNNPRRPLEASGTSGMKAASNGVLNLSVLDGWVAEGIEHGTTGWILDRVHPELNDSLGEDEKDLRALYRILRKQVIPTYYGQKEKWIEMMKYSIEMAVKDFSARRMLTDYFQKMYEKTKLTTWV
ncbi:MAG: alpha-glucan family phosphorylase [Halanaerobiales bacterium]